MHTDLSVAEFGVDLQAPEQRQHLQAHFLVAKELIYRFLHLDLYIR
jgi:hypothetical protein